MALSDLKYPKKSHRKEIRHPKKSKELAEFMGIVFGDGGINNDWQLTVTVNSEADRDYSEYVMRLGRELFNIDATAQKRVGKNALVLRFSSTNLVDFLVGMGAVRGNKVRQQIDTPVWIQDNEELERAFVRGLVDTDGCLFVHKHNVSGRSYSNIGFCFASYSKRLITSMAGILQKNGIHPYYARQMKCVYMYSKKAIQSYLSIFGTSNMRISSKYQEWMSTRTV